MTTRLLTAGWLAIGAALVMSAIEVIREGWAPLIDGALIAALTVDSASLDPPLVGMPTSLGLEEGVPLSHPGPLGFWLMALPTKLMGEPGDGLVIGSLLLSLATLAGVATVVRHRRDVALEIVSLALTATMIASIGPATFVNPFNPYIGILPLLLCLIGTWGALWGRSWEAMAVVVGGSLAAGAHLGYAPLVASMVLLTSGALVLDVVRAEGEARRRLVRRVIPAVLGAGILLWIGPLIDQVAGDGNLVNLLRNQSNDRSTVGLGHGVDLAVEMTSLPPRWIADRAVDMTISEPSPVRIVLSAALVALVVGILVLGVLRRRRDLAGVAVVSLVAIVVATVTSGRLVAPETAAFFDVRQAVLYRLFWWPVGALFATAVVWGSIRALQEVRGPDARVPRLSGPLRPVLLGVLAVAALGVIVGTRDEPQGLGEYATREQDNAGAIEDLPGSPDVVSLRFQPEGAEPTSVATDVERPPDVWDLGPDGRYGFAVNLVAQLRLRGIEVRFADEPADGITFMRSYRDQHPARGDEDDELLYLVGAQALEPAPEGYRLVATSGGGPAAAGNPLLVPASVFVKVDE